MEHTGLNTKCMGVCFPKSHHIDQLNYHLHFGVRGDVVVQWLGLLPQSKKVVGSFQTQGLSV